MRSYPLIIFLNFFYTGCQELGRTFRDQIYVWEISTGERGKNHYTKDQKCRSKRFYLLQFSLVVLGKYTAGVNKARRMTIEKIVDCIIGRTATGRLRIPSTGRRSCCFDYFQKSLVIGPTTSSTSWMPSCPATRQTR